MIRGKYNPINIMIAIFSAVILSANIVLAASLPLPPNTRVVKNDTVATGGGDQEMTFCESSLKPEQISVFYRNELEKRGYSIFLQQANMAVYMKGKELFMVMVSAAGANKTNIVLTESGMNVADEMGKRSCEDIEAVPVYPGAVCMGSLRMKNARALNNRYSTSAGLEEVVNFYRLQMLQEGWVLEKDTNLSDSLPAEALNLGPEAGINMDLGNTIMLGYRGAQGNHCAIMIMSSPVSKGTIITITYYEENK